MSLPTNFFIGRGGGGAILFNDYGISSSDITSLTSIAYTNDILNSTIDAQPAKKSINSVLLDGTNASYDPTNARLVTSSGANATYSNTLYPRYFFPANNMGWGAVSSASDINDNGYFAEADNPSGGQLGSFSSIGGSHYVDSTSTKTVSNAIQYSQTQESDYDVKTKMYYKNASNSYAAQTIFTTTSSTPSTRHQRDLDATAGITFQGGKDQSGLTSGYSGQPSFAHARRYDNTGYTGHFETDYLNDGNQIHNTNGHCNKGAFLGGRTVGNSTYAYYFFQYNGWSGTGSDGYRHIQYSYNTATAGAISRSITGHNSKVVQDDKGYITTGNQVWPYGFFSDYQGNVNDAGTYGDIWFVDMSGTWNSSTGWPTHNIEANSDKKYISRIGGTTAAPIFAMWSNAQLEIRPFNPTTRAFGSTLATASFYSSDRVNGIWPVPNTNRILVSYYNGVQVFEAA